MPVTGTGMRYPASLWLRKVVGFRSDPHGQFCEIPNTNPRHSIADSV